MSAILTRITASLLVLAAPLALAQMTWDGNQALGDNVPSMDVVSNRLELKPGQREKLAPLFQQRIANIEKIAFQTKQNGLCFRVSHPGVVLQNTNAIPRHHQPKIKNAAIWHAFSRHACQRRQDDALHQFMMRQVRQNPICRVCTHTACIGPQIVVENCLVILRRHHRQRMGSVGKYQK